jgi:DNA-directed RNA polymerase subunit omega
MARVTAEDCLKKVETRFELANLAAERARMLLRGAKPVVETENREVVTALREIAQGMVYFMKPEAEEPDPPHKSGDQVDALSTEHPKIAEGGR